MTSSSHAALWHGADYNPEQWLETPEIWEADLRLMKLAHMSSATIGIFSWTMLEPREGEYRFDWMDNIFERLAGNGQRPRARGARIGVEGEHHGRTAGAAHLI